MKKIVIILIAIIGSLTAISITQHLSIKEYESAIKHYREAVWVYSKLDTLIGVTTDSLGNYFYVVEKNDSGGIVTYNDLAQKVQDLQRVILKKDFVILKAKQRYKFDYSLKDSANMLYIEIWDKQ